MALYMITERPSLMDLDFPFDPLWHMGSSLLTSRKVLHPSAFDGGFLTGGSASTMKLTYSDMTKEYCVSAATPGVKREDLKIEVVGGNQLEVTIDHKEGPADKKEGDTPDPAGAFVRKGYMMLTLPKDADTTTPRVEYADGLLRVLFTSSSPEESKKRMRLADAAHADLAQDYEARCDKVKKLREDFEKELKGAAEAQKNLREARHQEAARIAKERREISF